MSATGIRSIAKQIPALLLGYYDRHARTLPWRAMPGQPPTDPYKVWLSEIMLQQTTVAAVIPYFERFTQRWPSVTALAEADDAELMAAWAGLGYYARARNLLACARAVVREHGGRFPGEEAELRALPGIGAYTAAAIAAIAFGRRAVVIDGNVERVVTRLGAIDTPLPGAKAEIRVLAERLTPDERAGDFAQAMMDLGATICTPRAPACLACPITSSCEAASQGDPARYPVKAAKKARPTRRGTAYWVEASGQAWLVRRPEKGLLGGMTALPTSDWAESESALPAQPPCPGQWRRADEPIIHVFTHFRLELAVDRLDLAHRLPDEEMARIFGPGQWWPVKTLKDAGLPTLFAKAAQTAGLIDRKQSKAA